MMVGMPDGITGNARRSAVHARGCREKALKPVCRCVQPLATACHCRISVPGTASSACQILERANCAISSQSTRICAIDVDIIKLPRHLRSK